MHVRPCVESWLIEPVCGPLMYTFYISNRETESGIKKSDPKEKRQQRRIMHPIIAHRRKGNTSQHIVLWAAPAYHVPVLYVHASHILRHNPLLYNSVPDEVMMQGKMPARRKAGGKQRSVYSQFPATTMYRQPVLRSMPASPARADAFSDGSSTFPPNCFMNGRALCTA